MADRHKLSLCYNCDEPYVRGHKCPHLFYLEVSDYIVEEPEDDAPADAAALDTAEPAAFDPNAPMISLSAIMGIRTEDTMQLRIQMGAHEFTALLDSGSTHNFISTTAAHRIGLHFHDSHGTHVIVANGDRVACWGVARDVAIRIDKEHFTVDCYSIPLDCYDMVLGVAWLYTVGPILWDFDDLCMAFWHHGHRVLWKGIGSTRTELPPTGRLHAARGSKPAFLERILDSYADIFAAPSGLPPARPCDHWIHLKPNTEPVAVRPYRYPQLQKDELERQ